MQPTAEGKMIILLFGAPGSGKGTQARFISQCRGIPSISTGDILRSECRAGTTLGKKACAVLGHGGLVDDDTMNAIVAKRLQQSACRAGCILDGYPRTVPQAVSLSPLLEDSGCSAPTIIHLDVPDAALVARLSSRRYCPTCGHTYNLLAQLPARQRECDADGNALTQRPDDHADVVVDRLKAYHELTEPLIEYYQGPHYHRIDGDCRPEEISRKIENALTADAGEMRLFRSRIKDPD
jgi:adenylate kinase